MSNKSMVRHLPTVGRLLLGLPMLAFGLMGLLHPLQAPPTLPAGAQAFSHALEATGYMMPMIAITQIVAGLMLVANRFVPLALTLLAPFFVNSVLFHLFLEPSGLPPALVFTALNLALAWAHRDAFRGVLSAKG